MQEFIITTPEQLKTVISQTVKDELTRHLQAQLQPEPTNSRENDLLTRKQAAILLGVSLPTLNEWSKTGIVIGYRINTRVRYKRSELEQSLSQMKSSKTKFRA